MPVERLGAGATWVVLGEGRHNAIIRKYENNLDAGNLVVVLGEGGGDDRAIAEIGATEATGYNRREIMITSSGNVGGTGPDRQMRTDAQQALDNAKSTTIEIDLVRQDAYTRDFALGDRISIDLGEWGHFNLQVTAAEVTYDGDGRHVDITVGNERVGLMTLINQISAPDTLQRQ